MNKLFFAFSLLVLNSSCVNDESDSTFLLEFDEDPKLKTISIFSSLESTEILSIIRYEYENEEYGKLSKISYFGGDYEILINYVVFEYNSHSKPHKKINYNSNINSPTGFILLDSTLLSYADGNLIVEEIWYPLAGYVDSYKYEYANSHLIKKSKYHRQELENYIIFSYSDNNNTKEAYYSSNNEKIQSVLHDYTDELRIKSEFYNSIDELMRIINFTYDNNGNLIIEESNEIMPYGSLMDHVTRYEYFQP